MAIVEVHPGATEGSTQIAGVLTDATTGAALAGIEKTIAAWEATLEGTSAGEGVTTLVDLLQAEVATTLEKVSITTD